MDKKLSAEWKGEVHTLKEWAKITGINYMCLYERYVKGDRGDILFRTSLTFKCANCGKEFGSNRTIKKYCSNECYRIKNLEMQKAYQKKIKAKGVKKEKKLTVAEIAVKAKEAGMSYGQYSAMLALRKEREANGKV